MDAGTATIDCPRCGRQIRLVIGTEPIGESGRLTVTATVPEIEKIRHRNCRPEGR